MKLNCKKKLYFGLMVLFLAGMAFSTISVAKTMNKSKISKSILADNAIVNVKSYGFVDLEGAKTSAIIVEYNQDIKASSVDKNDYEITDYAIYSEKKDGFEKTVEIDRDGTKGNEGQITKVYVNKKIARSRRLSISERWIVFFVKKLKKGYIHDKISKEIIKSNIQNQKKV